MSFDVEGFTGENKPLKFDAFLLTAFLLSFLFLLFYGTYSLYFLSTFFNSLNLPLYLIIFVPIFTGALATSAVYVVLIFINKYGMEGLVLSSGLMYLLVFLLIAMLIPVLGIFIGVFGFIIIGGIWFSTSVERERAKRFLESTVEVMIDEKELILPTFIFFIVSAYLCVSYIGFITQSGILELVLMQGKVRVGAIDAIPFLISIFIFVYVQMVIFQMLMGIVVGITYIWHRGKDPDLRDGIYLVLHRIDQITEFAVYAAVYNTIAWSFILFGKLGGAIISWIMNHGWGMINYFSLQTVVITGLDAKKAIKVSGKLFAKNIPDILVKELFVDTGLEFIFKLLSMPFYFLGFGLAFATGNMGLAILIIYSASITYGLFAFTMNHVYRTFLFSWALEKELGKEGDGKLPKGIRKVIQRIESSKKPDSEIDKILGRYKEGKRRDTSSHGIDWSYITQDRKKNSR